jgi:hypothetical protein
LYYNPKTDANETLISTTLPTDQLLWSPEWVSTGMLMEKTTQIRGGSGIFTGKTSICMVEIKVSGADDGFFQIMDKKL